MKLFRFWFGIAFVGVLAAQTPASDTFLNPLLPSGPDPWVIYRDGYYYYMNTMNDNVTIWKTRDITDLKDAERKVVWRPPPEGPYSHELWAPELHFLNGKWYLYVTADAGKNETHRIWVLENASPDPLMGEWVMKGKLADRKDRWAIDPSVFENRGKLYAIWSGWEGVESGNQNIYIAELKNPWTMEGKRVRISKPSFRWEQFGDPLDPNRIDINEGPEILKHEDKIFLIYSGNGCSTDHYLLGMLTASVTSNLLRASSWKKAPHPVFESSPEAHAFGTGHNTFFKSPDGTEDWILYHANPEPNQGCGALRSPRAQPFTWRPDGTPDFGRPLPLNKPIRKPSGTR